MDPLRIERNWRLHARRWARALLPARVGWVASLDVVVVVAVLDDLALAVEVQDRHTRVGEFLASLGPAGPPLDRSPFSRHDRLPKPALDILLGRELLAEIAADASQAPFRLAERGRAVQHRLGIQGGDGLGIALRPGPRPGVRPAPGGGSSIHASDSNRPPAAPHVGPPTRRGSASNVAASLKHAEPRVRRTARKGRWRGSCGWPGLGEGGRFAGDVVGLASPVAEP